MKTTYTIIRADGTSEKVTVELSNKREKRSQEINDLCRKVIDGWLEPVRVYWLGSYTYMIVDEEGKLKGKAFNPVATAIYWNNVRVHHPERYNDQTDYIAGDAVLFEKGVVT